jgi:hypothetical protein
MNTGQSEKFALELRLFSELHKLGCPAFKRAFCLGVRTLDPQANIGPMRCEKHPDTELVCPACAGVRGGQARANKLSWDQRREIARLGGLATRGRRKRRRKEQPSGELRLSQGLPTPVRVRPTGDEW